MNHNRGGTFLPLNEAGKNMAVYCYSYHMNVGSNQLEDDFWADKNIHQILLRERFESTIDRSRDGLATPKQSERLGQPVTTKKLISIAF